MTCRILHPPILQRRFLNEKLKHISEKVSAAAGEAQLSEIYGLIYKEKITKKPQR